MEYNNISVAETNKDIEIIYEDNHLLVVNKPAGFITHDDEDGNPAWNLTKVISEFIRVRDGKPGNVFLHPAHRLDKPVTGAIIFCKTSKSLARMNEQFKQRLVRKTYFAISMHQSRFLEGKLEHYLLENKTRVVAMSKPTEDAKRAELDFEMKSHIGEHYLYEIKPVTGRKHQIRSQMQWIKCPISGDTLYGGERIKNYRGILLHSRSIEFMHPTKKEPLRIIAQLPKYQTWKMFRQFA